MTDNKADKPSPAPAAKSTAKPAPARTVIERDNAPTLAAAVASANSRNPNIKGDANTDNMSSVGADLSPEAKTFKEDGVTVLDAGGDNVSAAPLPTPAEAVAYPATGGLPDTGPNSKYVEKTISVVELFNRDGHRVDRDGRLIDPFGDRIPRKGEDEVLKTQPGRGKPVFSKSTKAEMDAGKRALGAR